MKQDSQQQHPDQSSPLSRIEASHTIRPDCGPRFEQILAQHDLKLRRTAVTELQINLGKLCNLACHHCHVDAGPKRREIMSWETMQRILDWIDLNPIKKVDLTGGAPELNPQFRAFCSALLERHIEITSRCNITVLYEPNQHDLATWYADNRIRLVCSLPCYTEDNVDAQRGKGTFDKSIRGLRLLNQQGYGCQPSLPLDLVYNPGGAFLPPPQATLEADYKKFLHEHFSIHFSNLIVITNIPINRFAHSLNRDDQASTYQHLLVDNFNPETVEHVMCRHLINVDWQGFTYDCDFNQMLDLPLSGSSPTPLWKLNLTEINDKTIAIDRHCFGCTAGAGSSCGGTLAS